MSPQKRVSAGGVVVGPTGFIVVVSQNGDSWSLPKGHVDPGETAREAAEREIAEESGITELRYVSDLGEYERYQIGKGGVGYNKTELKHIVIFLYKTDQNELKPTDPVNPEARWVAIDDVSTILSNAEDAAFFESVKPQVVELLAKP